jgi:hypothetical protein
MSFRNPTWSVAGLAMLLSASLPAQGQGSFQNLGFELAVIFEGPIGGLVVRLGGEQLSLTPLSSGANYTLYGADIHTWAGRWQNSTSP